MHTYHLKITPCSPVHIGSGKAPLRKGIDFVTYNRTIYVFDLGRVLDYLVGDLDDAALLEQITHTRNIASFLTEQDFRDHPDLALYRLRGTPGVNEVQPQMKDVYDAPYIPGSSLKGALRTAILDMALLHQGRRIDVRRLGERGKFAAQDLERDVVGRGEKHWQAPNYDLFRALHVADSAPGAREWLGISNVVVWPTGTKGIPIDVETIQPECTFTASLTIDTYLFSEQAQQLKLGPKRGLLENLAATCREHAQARIAHEQAFFQQHREQAPQRFYTELAAQLAACDSMSFLLQLGWGAGWGSKTVEQTLRASEGAVAAAVRRYRLDRGKGRGREFPATRHLVTARQRVVEPLGWVRVEMKERTG